MKKVHTLPKYGEYLLRRVDNHTFIVKIIKMTEKVDDTHARYKVKCIKDFNIPSSIKFPRFSDSFNIRTIKHRHYHSWCNKERGFDYILTEDELLARLI